MPARKRRPSQAELFEQLGLLAETEQTNPLHLLGIAPSLAHDLLAEDSSGARLQRVAWALHRVFTPMYHPDQAADSPANAKRFREIEEARAAIADATPAALKRWAQAEGAPVASAQTKQQQERTKALADGAAALIRQNMELGGDPRHFSQLAWSQGVLATGNKGTPLLVRPRPQGGVRVQRGTRIALDEASGPHGADTQAFDFEQFLLRHRSFGLEPGEDIAAYFDERGRASILGGHDLDFVMDISGPVGEYRAERKRQRGPRRRGVSDLPPGAWARITDPLLITTKIPRPDGVEEPTARIVTFPGPNSVAETVGAVWDLSLDVAGTLSNETFFADHRHTRHAGAAALTGSGARAVGYFSMVATPAETLIEDAAGYSPLLAAGDALLLYDSEAHMPVATNANVLGMLGNGPQY